MNRRDHLQLLAALGIGHGLLVPAFGLGLPKYDRFGGWTGKKFKATGFFRVEKDQRWWLVTPDGNAFLSFGINHMHANWWRQDFNQQAWNNILGLKDAQTEEFSPAIRNWLVDICKTYGFNSIGVHNDLASINSPTPVLPYMQPIRFVDIPHWRQEVKDENFLDVYSDSFAERCDRLAKEIAAPKKNDPYLLGYAMTDCPLLTEEDCRERPNVIGGAPRKARIGWPRRLRNLGPGAAGKQAYVAVMQDLYNGHIEDFNTTYQTDFGSFQELEAASDWRTHTDLSNGNETRDNIEFLKNVVSKYYQTASAAIRRYDPNHLFVGDKLNANTDTVDSLLPITSQFTDLILYQMYGRSDYHLSGLDRWVGSVDKPFINGDAAFTMVSPNMPRPYGPIADNIQQRADWTQEFFYDAFARKEFVGWHYCGLIDAPNLIDGKKERQHSGVMNAYGEPYPLLQEVLKACADQLYSIADVG